MSRVWDRFLTDQDKAYDAARPRFSKKREFGRRPALILVDLYRCAFGDTPEPLLEAVVENRHHLGLAAWDALPDIMKLLGAAREAKIPVIHVSRIVELSEWGEFGRSDRTPTPEEFAQRVSDYEIFDPLAPVAGELVVRKRSASAFGSTPLAAVLNQFAADTLIIGGESTSGCVRATVVDGRDLRFTIVIPETCVFDRTEASHAINLYDMHRKYAHVVSLRDALDYLEGVEPFPWV